MLQEKYTPILESFRTTGLMLYFSHPDVDTCEKIIDIAYRHGVRAIEFSYTRDPRSVQLFSYLVERTHRYPHLFFGAGMVLNAKTAESYLKRGAHFIASPFLHDDMADVCARYEKTWIPGCQSSTEIEHAKSLGAKVVSVLPGNDSIPSALISHLNHDDIHFIPSAAFKITEENLYQWIEARALCIRMGPSLLTKETVLIRDWGRIERNIYTAMATIKNARRKLVSESV